MLVTPPHKSFKTSERVSMREEGNYIHLNNPGTIIITCPTGQKIDKNEYMANMARTRIITSICCEQFALTT